MDLMYLIILFQFLFAFNNTFSILGLGLRLSQARPLNMHDVYIFQHFGTFTYLFFCTWERERKESRKKDLNHANVESSRKGCAHTTFVITPQSTISCLCSKLTHTQREFILYGVGLCNMRSISVFNCLLECKKKLTKDIAP